MNRRTFLFALGASACGGNGTRRRTRVPKPKPIRQHEPHITSDYDPSFISSQRRRSPFAFHGDFLVQSTGEELRKWNTTSMKRVSTWNLPHTGFCVVQDGSIVACKFPPQTSHGTFYRIDATGNLETLQGSVFQSGPTARLLPARAPDQVYMVDDDDVFALKLTGRDVEEIESMRFPYRFSNDREQLFSRGDGQLVGFDADGGFRVFEPSRPDAVYRIPGRVRLHLAAASRNRIWYSYPSTAQHWNANMLALARVETPMVAEQQLDFAPWRIYHLASNGRTAVALLVKLVAMNDWRWAVAVIDESGRERWRANVPGEVDPLYRSAMNGFVAISDRRVVLRRSEDDLLAWDAANGKLVR